MSVTCSLSNNEIIEGEQTVLIFVAKRQHAKHKPYIEHDTMSDYVPISPPFLAEYCEFGDHTPMNDASSFIHNTVCLDLFKVACTHSGHTLTADAQTSLDAMMTTLAPLPIDEQINHLTGGGFYNAKDVSVMPIHYSLYTSLIEKVYHMKATDLFFNASSDDPLKTKIKQDVQHAITYVANLSHEAYYTEYDDLLECSRNEFKTKTFLSDNQLTIQTLLFDTNQFEVSNGYPIAFYTAIAELSKQYDTVPSLIADFFAFKYALFRMSVKYGAALHGSQFGNASFSLTIAKNLITIAQNRVINYIINEQEMTSRHVLDDIKKTTAKADIIRHVKQLSLDELETILSKIE